MTTDMSMKGLFIRNSFTNIKFDLVIQGIFPAYFLKIVVFNNQKEKNGIYTLIYPRRFKDA